MRLGYISAAFVIQFITDPPDGEVQNFTFTMPASDVRLDYCKMEPESYIDEEGKDVQCWDYTYLGQLRSFVSGEGSTIDDLNKGWYVTTDEEDINLKRAVCKGDVNIVLADDSSTTFGRGIEVNESNEASLTIWGQKKGSGRLEAYSYYENEGDTGVYDAAIGGGQWDQAKARITINGGKVNASGGGAGIGTGPSSCQGFGEIKITGGSVTAKSRSKEIAGIGGLSKGNEDTITINGGTVNAEGSPAIGVTGKEETGKITVSGGTTTAQGTEYGSGLRASSVIITKGTVNAYGAGKGAGIGGGDGDPLAGPVTISGGKVFAYGGDQGAGADPCAFLG